MKEKSSIFRFKPEKIGDKYWCHICSWTYPYNHKHFDFSRQTNLEDLSKDNILKEYNVSEVRCTCLINGVEFCEVKHD